MALGSAWFSVKRRGFATGIVSGGIGLGTFLSGIIVPFILTSYGADGWRYSWYILGTLVLLSAVIVFLFLRNQPEDMGLLPVGQEKTADIQNSSSKNKTTALDWGKVYRMKALWFLGLVYFFYGLSYIIYIVFFATYLIKEMGYSEAWAGGLWATVGGLSIFCGVIWGSISDRIGQSIGPALGGYLADVNHSFTLPFLFAGAISFVGMIFSLYLKKPEKKV
jgi:nitrate/nitrite transporter NarK